MNFFLSRTVIWPGEICFPYTVIRSKHAMCNTLLQNSCIIYSKNNLAWWNMQQKCFSSNNLRSSQLQTNLITWLVTFVSTPWPFLSSALKPCHITPIRPLPHCGASFFSLATCTTLLGISSFCITFECTLFSVTF